jgi:hypothetical protein
MRDRVVGDLVKAQVCLFGGLLLCVVLRSQGLVANEGISFYGRNLETLSPYAAGLLGTAALTRRALRSAAPGLPAPAPVRRAADAFALLLVGIILTPSTASSVVDWTHKTLGASLFVLQLLLAARLVAWAWGDPLGTALLLVQFAGGVASAVWVLQDHGFLIEGQVVFQLAFGVLLIRLVPLALPKAGEPDDSDHICRITRKRAPATDARLECGRGQDQQ